MIRVGIIGAGLMGRVHAAAYTHIPDSVLTAVADIRPEAASALAALSGAAVYTDGHELIRSGKVDVVDVALPTYLHKEYVLAAAAAGKHVFCEKPLALSLPDAREMIAACDQAGVKFMVGHVVRFFPEYAKLRQLAKAGEVGTPKFARTSRGGAFPAHGWQNWFADPAKSGGPLVDLVIHDFDWLRWVFGPVARVFAKSLTGRQLPNMDYCLTTVRFASGALAHVEGSWAAPAGAPFLTAVEIGGTGGLMEYRSQQAVGLRKTVKTPDHPIANAVPESPLQEDPYMLELRHFIHCVATGAQPLVTGQEALESLKVALAAAESARTGLPVEVNAHG